MKEEMKESIPTVPPIVLVDKRVSPLRWTFKDQSIFDIFLEYMEKRKDKPHTRQLLEELYQRYEDEYKHNEQKLNDYLLEIKRSHPLGPRLALFFLQLVSSHRETSRTAHHPLLVVRARQEHARQTLLVSTGGTFHSVNGNNATPRR